ncbi:MAG: hypothetical protein KGM91_18900 [Burkholderiales bacterium]|nr:hypothetical protein [Burkholderiales bacterium]
MSAADTRPAPTANLQGLTVKQAASIMNVSERGVYDARRLIRSARADLIAEVEAGRMSLNRALMLAGERALRSGLAALRNAWSRATPDERAAFLAERCAEDLGKQS